MASIKVFSETFTSASILSVQVGSNCPQGGDSGHGGRTLFRLTDEASTAWSVSVDGKVFDGPRQIEIVLGGDCEAETFVEALEFAAKVLRGQIGRSMWMQGADENVDLH